jgi:hypothetical protein
MAGSASEPAITTKIPGSAPWWTTVATRGGQEAQDGLAWRQPDTRISSGTRNRGIERHEHAVRIVFVEPDMQAPVIGLNGRAAHIEQVPVE